MALYIYNSLTRQKEKFEPLNPKQVKIYSCGPTVYDFLHIGNFRGPVFFNLLRNWLEYLGYKVTSVLNFTDVDDRIIDRANQEGKSAEEISERYIAEYKKDFAYLGIRAHDANPKVTETMPEIIEMISRLIEKKMAYKVDGDVMYSIKNFSDYGKLSGRKPEDMMAGARVEIDEKKQSPLDFALWKGAKDGEPYWNSPWGKGRPGWHIECSAMVCKHLGEQIDIHGGGMDLIFPHHENEIAQSEGVSNKFLAKYWMHWNMLNFGGQKMSKSLGNFTTLRKFLEKYNSEIYKWMILSVHYRSLSDFSDEGMHRAIASLARIYSALGVAESYLSENPLDFTTKVHTLVENQGAIKLDSAFEKITDEAWKKVENSLNDDFNTPEAFAAVFEVVRNYNQQCKRGMKANDAVIGKSASFVKFIYRIGKLSALFQHTPSEFLTTLDDMLLKQMNLQRTEIDKLVLERSEARNQKDFKKSDEIRDRLAQIGISVSDTAKGSFWEVSK